MQHHSYGPLIAFKRLGTSVVTSCSSEKIKCKNTDLDEYILDNKHEIIMLVKVSCTVSSQIKVSCK